MSGILTVSRLVLVKVRLRFILRRWANVAGQINVVSLTPAGKRVSYHLSIYLSIYLFRYIFINLPFLITLYDDNPSDNPPDIYIHSYDNPPLVILIILILLT